METVIPLIYMDHIKPMNIRFNYLYRDATNYKQFGSVIISNPNGLTLEELDLFLKKHLIQDEFFVPSNLGIPQTSGFPLRYGCRP